MATIRKRQNRWQVQVRRKDCLPISKSFNRRSDAEEWARHMEVQADRNELPLPNRTLSKLTLKELMERYRDEVAAKKKSYPTEKYMINQLIRHPMAQKKLDQLSEADFVHYKEARLVKIKSSSFNREIGIVHHAYEVATTQWGIVIRKNPFDRFKKPKANDERQRRLRGDEYEKIQKAISSKANPNLRPLIDLGIETAMRKGEMLAIKETHIDIDSRTLKIPETKTGYPRTIPLSSKAVDILRSAIQRGTQEGRLFPVTSNAIRLSWERVLERAKIEGLTFHDLRHEAISRLFEKGLSVPEVALISGHRNYKMLMRYTHMNPENIVSKLG